MRSLVSAALSILVAGSPAFAQIRYVEPAPGSVDGAGLPADGMRLPGSEDASMPLSDPSYGPALPMTVDVPLEDPALAEERERQGALARGQVLDRFERGETLERSETRSRAIASERTRWLNAAPEQAAPSLSNVFDREGSRPSLSNIELVQPLSAAPEQGPVVSEATKSKILAKFGAFKNENLLENLKWRPSMPLGVRYVGVPLTQAQMADSYQYTALLPAGALTPTAPVEDPNQASYFILKRTGGIAGTTMYSNPISLAEGVVAFAAPQAPKPAPQPPAKTDLTWKQFFSGLAGSVLGLPTSLAASTGLAAWYAPQAYGLGYQEIFTDKSIGVKRKAGQAFLLTLGVPLGLAISPLAGAIHGLIRGFIGARDTNPLDGARKVLQDLKDLKRYADKAKVQIKSELERRKHEPAPPKKQDITLVQLAKGVGGSLLALGPIPLPAFLIVLGQSPRVLFYGLKATWSNKDYGTRWKTVATLLFVAAYALVNVLALPAAALAALALGFHYGYRDGVGKVLSKSWQTVKDINSAINRAVDDFKKGRGPDLPGRPPRR